MQDTPNGYLKATLYTFVILAIFFIGSLFYIKYGISRVTTESSISDAQIRVQDTNEVQEDIPPSTAISTTNSAPEENKKTAIVPTSSPISKPLIQTQDNTPIPTSTSPSNKNSPPALKQYTLISSNCTLDYSLVPQAETNARRLFSFCQKQIPFIEAKFGRNQSVYPYKIQYFKSRVENDTDAYATPDNGVFLNTNFWTTPFEGDEKILAHELTHAIQSFKGYNSPEFPGWLIEALADYGAYVAGYENDLNSRCYHFSNQREIKVFECSYKFLKFIEETYDQNFTVKLHKALQTATYSDKLFINYTQKTYTQLLEECSHVLSCGGTDPL